MSCRLVSFTFIVAFAFVSAIPGTAMAQPRGGVPAFHTGDLPSPSDLLAQAWSGLARLWNKAGCLIDPSGLNAWEPVPAQGEEGCLIDPDGRCLKSTGLAAPGSSSQTTPPTQGEEGCLIDPNGLCLKTTGR